MFGSGLDMTCCGDGDMDGKRPSCRASCFVGVGGYSPVDWLSVGAEGDGGCTLSSASIETREAKLAFRARVRLALVENRFELLVAQGNCVDLVMPKGTSEGDRGVPTGAWMLRIVAFTGLPLSFGGGNIMVCFLQGVSGICALGRPASASLTFRFFLEIKPVDMNATGLGFTVLKAEGVAKEPWEENSVDWLSCSSCGRRAPMGKDLEKSCERDRFVRRGGSCVGESSCTLEVVDEDCVMVAARGCRNCLASWLASWLETMGCMEAFNKSP